jgi:hypothetical protein
LLSDIFAEGFDADKIIAGALNKVIEQHKLYSDYEFRKWLSVQRFPYFLIHRDGIAFCTAFDPVYGRQTIKIPYEQLKPFLKENSLLQHFIN